VALAVRLPRPTPKLAPLNFFVDYLPALARALRPTWPVVPEPLEVEIVLDGKDTFTLGLTARGLASRAGPGSAPLARARLSTSAWRTLALDLLPRVLRLFDERLAKAGRDDANPLALPRPASAADLLAASGTVEVGYVDDAGERIEVNVSIADGQGPRAHLDVTDAELWRLLEGESSLAAAIARLKVKGDAGYLIRLATLLTKPA